MNNQNNKELSNQITKLETKPNNEKDNENKLNNEINNNKELLNEIQKLKTELNNEKDKNKKLIDEINIYKNKNIELQTNLNNLKNDLKDKEMKIQELNKLIINLKNKNNNISDYNSNLCNIKPGETILCIQFKSLDSKIDYSIPCKNTDIFVRLEERLYEEYPECKETNNYFTCNGEIILRFKSIDDNKLKTGDKILLNN